MAVAKKTHHMGTLTGIRMKFHLILSLDLQHLTGQEACIAETASLGLRDCAECKERPLHGDNDREKC